MSLMLKLYDSYQQTDGTRRPALDVTALDPKTHEIAHPEFFQTFFPPGNKTVQVVNIKIQHSYDGPHAYRSPLSPV